MSSSSNGILLSEDDLREIFSLFSSPTTYEKQQVYDECSEHYFRNVDLSEEYILAQEKREYSLDAWRAVISFLNARNFTLRKDGKEINLEFVDGEFM
jgi:hypothetical protein